jgi:hypothetical protein
VPATLPLTHADWMIESFDQKPAKPSPPIPVTSTPTPVMASVPITITQKVIGISFRSAP